MYIGCFFSLQQRGISDAVDGKEWNVADFRGKGWPEAFGGVPTDEDRFLTRFEGGGVGGWV